MRWVPLKGKQTVCPAGKRDLFVKQLHSLCSNRPLICLFLFTWKALGVQGGEGHVVSENQNEMRIYVI